MHNGWCLCSCLLRLEQLGDRNAAVKPAVHCCLRHAAANARCAAKQGQGAVAAWAQQGRCPAKTSCCITACIARPVKHNVCRDKRAVGDGRRQQVRRLALPGTCERRARGRCNGVILSRA